MRPIKASRHLALAAAIFLTGAVAATAQPAPAPGTDPSYDLLFQRVLREPSNLDLSFKFANTASEKGDLEAAIGALERMVFYNPNLPRVKLELGVLYYRLGSYEMARSYLEGAVEGSNVPAEVSEKVKLYLAEIDRRLAPAQWSFYGQAGFRYQSNATAGPSSPYVRASGFDAILDRAFVKRPDWNAFALGSLRNVYDFGNQRGDVWDTTITTYYARQFTYDRFNLGLLEGQTGPRLALAPDTFPGLSIHPYIIGAGVILGDRAYLGSVGGGVSVAIPISGIGYIEPFTEVRSRSFANTRDFVTASEQSGTLWTTGAAATGDIIGPVLRWQARLTYSQADTRRGYTDYDQVAFDAGFPIEFTGLWGARPWIATPFAGVTSTDYRTPNAVVDPFIKRSELEVRGGLQLDVPIRDLVGLGITVQYASVDASLPNYRTNNFSIVFGPTIRY